MAPIARHTIPPTAAHPSSAQTPEVWAVASGKGGVGKSFITANLGVALARQKKKVVLVDLDLGSANLHTCLGIEASGKSLSDFLHHSEVGLDDIATPTSIEGLKLISGASDNLQMANLPFAQKSKIARHLKRIDADIVLLDLGAGTAYNTLDFFITANRGILPVVPEPTSVENTYRFLKCLFNRKLRSAPEHTRKLMQKILIAKQDDGRKIRTLASFLNAMSQRHPEHGEWLRRSLAELDLHLIVNQADDPADTELGRAMQMACQHYFASSLNYLGYLPFDRSVPKTLRQRKPFLLANPQSRIAIHFEHMVASLIEGEATRSAQA